VSAVKRRPLPRVLLVALCALALVPAARAQRVREVQIAPPFLKLHADAETRVLATAYDWNGTPVSTTFRWTSSNINIVTVTPDGLIRAVAPGVAIVTASVDSGPRRRGGQITVFVARPGPPAMPATPGMPPTPGVPQPPSHPMAHVNIDSIVRASVDCADPFINSVNPARACWNRRPYPRAAPVIAVPAACDRPPREVHVFIQVAEDGATLEARAFMPSLCPAFTDSAVAFARSLTFEPAQKEGRPVRAWVRLPVRARTP